MTDQGMKPEAVVSPKGVETLAVESLAYGGDGVAHLDSRVVFVSGGLPGDVVRARIAQDKGSYLRAELIEVLEPSPDRVEPFCPLADRCGGCQWQELSYPAQLRWKQVIVEESLRRLGGFVEIPVEPCLPSPEDRGWRTAARFPARPEKGRLITGYYGRRSNTLVEIPFCPAATDRVNAIAALLRSLPRIGKVDIREVTVRASRNHPSALVSILTGRHTDIRPHASALLESGMGIEGVCLNVETAPGKSRRIKVFGSPYRFEEVSGRTFRIEEQSFFQINIPQAEQLAARAWDALRSGKGDSLTDGYGGVGLFSLGSAGFGADIRLFDTAAPAVEDAAENARTLGFSRFRGHAGDAPESFGTFGPSGRLIIDPPRTGLGLKALEALVRFDAERIAYVSCNPTTLARDLRLFAERGYETVRVIPVDMFPHTYHIETVAELARE